MRKFIFFMLISSLVNAEILLNNVIVDYHPSKPKHKDIEVSNTSNKNAYVKVTIKEVINPGRKNEQRNIVKSSADSLVVSPQKLIIPPKGKKRLRFISMHKNLKEDKIYRVNVVPVVGKLKAEQTSIKILVGYDVLVIARPNNIIENLQSKRNGKNISFTNNGNSSILFRRGEQCHKSVCKKISGKRLYPGMNWNVELPYNKPVDFVYSLEDKIETRTFN